MKQYTRILVSFYLILAIMVSLTPPVSAAPQSFQLFDFPNDYVVVYNIPAFNLGTVDIKSVSLLLDGKELKIEIAYYQSVNVHVYARDHNGEALADTYIKFGRSGGPMVSLHVNTTRFDTNYAVTGVQDIPEGSVIIDNVDITSNKLVIDLIIDDPVALGELGALFAAGNLDVYVKSSLLVLYHNTLLSYDEVPSPPPINPPPFPFPIVVGNTPLWPNLTPANPPLWPTHIIVDLPWIEINVDNADPDYPGPTDGPNYTVPDGYMTLAFRVSGSSATKVSHIGVVLDIGSPKTGWLSTTFNIRGAEAGFLDEDGPANGFMIEETYGNMSVKAMVAMKQDGNWANWVLEGTIYIALDPEFMTGGNSTQGEWTRVILAILEAVNDGSATAQVTVIAYTDEAENTGTAATIKIPLQSKATSQKSEATQETIQEEASKPNEQAEQATQAGQSSQTEATQQEPAQDAQNPATSETQVKDTTTTPPDGNPDETDFPVPDDGRPRPIPIAFNTSTLALIIISMLAGVVLAILFRRR